MPVGAIIGAVGSVAGAAITSSGAQSAANTAAQTAAANNALQQQIYNQNVGYATPFLNRGNAAGDELAGFLGLGGDPAKSQAALNTYLNSTGYQFAKSEGMNAVTGDKAAAGLLNSGSTLQSLDAFGTGLANEYAGNYIGGLENLNASGQAAQGSLAGIGENYANQVSSNNNNAASAAANAAIASSNAWGNALGGLGNAFGFSRGLSSFGAAAAAPAAATPSRRHGWEAEAMSEGINIDWGQVRQAPDPVTSYANAFQAGLGLAKSAGKGNAMRVERPDADLSGGGLDGLSSGAAYGDSRAGRDCWELEPGFDDPAIRCATSGARSPRAGAGRARGPGGGIGRLRSYRRGANAGGGGDRRGAPKPRRLNIAASKATCYLGPCRPRPTPPKPRAVAPSRSSVTPTPARLR